MRNAIARAPENVDYRYRYGLLLVDSKAPAAAIIRLGEYVKQFPTAAKLWLCLGIAYVYDGKSPEAGASFERALELEPKMLPALAYLANTYTEVARYGEATKVYERAIAISGGKQPIFQYLLADTLLNVPDADQRRIEALLKQATDLDPGFGSAFSALATLYARQQRWTEAVAAFENAVRIDPKDTKSLYQLSRVYARLKKIEQSRAVLERFKRLTEEEKERKEIDRRDMVRRLADVRF
jgi:tetratricopeptide (TPR) repeat protein